MMLTAKLIVSEPIKISEVSDSELTSVAGLHLEGNADAALADGGADPLSWM
jgi:hypothetical protein